jgi:hypothetical protein
MPSSSRSLVRPELALLALALAPRPATAQHSFHFQRSFDLAHVYDDNLFSTPSARQADDIWRLSPFLRLERRSPTLTVQARYGLDAEVFGHHPELNTPAARQDGALELALAPSPRWDLGATAGYATGQAPGELNTLTGLQSGRLPSQRLSAGQSLSRRLGPVTRARVQHTFTRELTEGRPTLDTQTATVTVERRLGAADRTRLAYGLRRFVSAETATASHAVTVGWSRDVSPLSQIDLEGGPLLTEGTVKPEVALALSHRFRRGQAALAYVHTQTTVVGHPRPVTAEGLSLTFSRQLLGSLRIGGGPAVFRVRDRDAETTVHRVGLDLTWRLTGTMSLAASHQFSAQQGALGADPEATIKHNLVLVRLIAAGGR